MSANIDFILHTYDALYSEQSQFRDLWQEQGYYVIPSRSGILNTLIPGAQATAELYDSTPIYSNRMIAARMSYGLTPQSSKWFSLTTPSEQLNDIKSIQDWLEDATDRQLMAYRQSNFYAEIDSTYLDWPSIATIGMYCDKEPREGDRFKNLNFTGLTPGTYVIAEDIAGKTNTVIRTFQTEAANVAKEWGVRNVGSKVRALIDGNKPFEMVEVVHAVMPREVWAFDRGNQFYPWMSAYIVKGDRTLLYEGEYMEFPYSVGRWTKSSGEKYGRGPGMDAMPDIKTRNKSREYGLKNLALALAPPLQILDGGVLSSIDLSPGAQNLVKMRDTITPIELGLERSLKIEQLKDEDLKQSIKDIFLTGQLSIERSPQMTAGEYFSRVQENEQILSPMLGRVYFEYLKSIVERSFYILYRAQQFPPPPAELVQSGSEIDIEFEGPLAKGQKMHEVESYYRCIELAASLAQIAPEKAAEVLDWLNTDEVFPTLAPILGLNGKLVRDMKEVQAIKDKRQQEMAAMQMKQDIAGMAEAAGKATPALKLLQGGQSGQTPA